MRLSKKQKQEIYEKYQDGYTAKELRSLYPINESGIYQLIRMINHHGLDWIYRPYKKWTVQEKESIILPVLLGEKSLRESALEAGISTGQLSNWIQSYKKNGYNVVEKKKGRPRKMPKKKENKNQKELTQIEKLEKEIQRLRAENAYLKYLRENGLVDEEK